jgi:hypothetical protein
MSFSFNESDTQRIAVVVTIVGLNCRNQQKHKKDDDYRHHEECTDTDTTQKY